MDRIMTNGPLSAATAPPAIGISPTDEKRIARELSPAVAWPTLALSVVLPSTFATVVALGLAGAVPLGVCALTLTVVCYAHYTLVHESIHDNLVPGHPRLRWLNDVVGWIGSLVLSHDWPYLMRSHVLHHAHTNTDKDPDIFVKGSFIQLLGAAAIYGFFALIPPPLIKFIDRARYMKLRDMAQGSELIQASVVRMLTWVLLAAAIYYGHVLDWLCLWFIPTRAALLILLILFSWLPHYPFDRTERYYNTRISLWTGGTVLTLQQNLHLMHHLWPSVPFYNYARFYERLRPLLLAKGARIEGLVVGPHIRLINP